MGIGVYGNKEICEYGNKYISYNGTREKVKG